MPKTQAFARWLRSSEAHPFLDDAVLGSLEQSYAEEVAQDFGYDLSIKEQRRAFSAVINEALCGGF